MSDLTDDVLRAVAAEREHQDAENGPDHDDEHQHGELAIAAAVMLLNETDFTIDCGHEQMDDSPWLNAWGYADKYADNHKRQLLIAAAWAVAELERILRDDQRRAIAPALVSRFKQPPPAAGTGREGK